MIKKILAFPSALLFFFFVSLTGIIPFRLLYVFSDGVAWLLRKVIKYRLGVIRDNLYSSNLSLSREEKEGLIPQIYRNLSDLLIESLKSFTMSRSSIVKRHRVLNPEILQPFYANKKSVILVTGHIGNWEWGSLSAGLQTSSQVLAFYKPLKNKYINNFLKRSRARFGSILAPIKQTSLTFEKFKNTPSIYLMAADQSPVKLDYAHWLNFLGRETAFLHGPEKHARNNNLPVVFVDIRRKKRGYYEITLSTLTENPQQTKEGQITRKYAGMLESVIKEEPASWLWSHKRWKHQRKGR